MLSDAVILTASSILRYGGQLVLLIAISRSLGADDAGLFTLALAITMPLFVLGSLGFRTVYLTLQRPVAPTTYLRVRHASLVAVILAAVTVAVFGVPAMCSVVLAVAGLKAIDLYVDISSAFYQGAGLYYRILRVSAGAFGAIVIGVIIALLADLDLTSGLLVVMAIQAVYVFCLVLPRSLRAATADRPIPPGGAALVLRAGLPVGISTAIVSLLSAAPQYVLGMASLSSVAHFAILLYLVVAVEIAINALAQAWLPRGVAKHATGELPLEAVVGLGTKWGAGATLLGVPILLAAHYLLPVVFGPFATLEMDLMLPLLFCMAVLPHTHLASRVLAVRNRYVLTLITSTVSLAGGLAATLMLVPPHGIAGALWAYALTLLLRTCLAYVAAGARRRGSALAPARRR